ncbi:MAG: DMT family transporter [Candidatus Saccharibacteria bacterium]
MSWQLLILLNALFVGVSVILMRILARDKANAGASFMINAGQFVPLWFVGLVLLPTLGQIDSHALSHFFWRLAGGGLAFALTYTCTYKSLVYLDAAVGSIFSTLNALFTVGLAALVLHEDLSTMQLLGGIILTAAIIYTTLAVRTAKNKASRRELAYGLAYAVLAGLIYAVAIVNEKSLLHQMSTASYVLFGWGWQMLAAVVAAFVLQASKFKVLLKRRTILLVSGAGILRGLGGIAFVLAQVRSNNVAVITVISSLKLVVVVILGRGCYMNIRNFGRRQPAP